MTDNTYITSDSSSSDEDDSTEPALGKKQKLDCHTGNESESTFTYMDNWSRPSSSGLNFQSQGDSMEPANIIKASSHSAKVAVLKAKFPEVEEEVLKTSLTYYDVEECIQAISNVLKPDQDNLSTASTSSEILPTMTTLAANHSTTAALLYDTLPLMATGKTESVNKSLYTAVNGFTKDDLTAAIEIALTPDDVGLCIDISTLLQVEINWRDVVIPRSLRKMKTVHRCGVHSATLPSTSLKEEMADKDEILCILYPEVDVNYILYILEVFQDSPDRMNKVEKLLIQKSKKNSESENSDISGTNVTWSWESKKRAKLNTFSEEDSNCIERRFKIYKGQWVNIYFPGCKKPLTFDFHLMRMTDFATDISVRIQRTDNNHNEESQSNQHQGAVQEPRSLMKVFPETSEFCRVESLLQKTIPQACVTKIQRIQNNWLHQKYNNQHELLKKKNGQANVNIKELFHGTRETPPQKIWDSEEGFDVCHPNGGLWGEGCYFAVQASYSHKYSFMKKNTVGYTKYKIFLAQVLTGNSINLQPTNSTKSIIKPPLNPQTGWDYDSVTGLVKGDRIYVLYKNDQSYPAYLITYTLPVNIGKTFKIKIKNR